MLDVGDALPDLKLAGLDAAGNVCESSLLELARQSGGLVVYVYPKDDTPGCTTQACDFRDAKASGLGLTVVGISPDSVASHQRFRDKHGLTFALLCDPERRVLSLLGAFGEKKMYGKTVEGVIRSTFVANGQGILTHVYRSVKATGHVARIMAHHGKEA
ncbi:MAG: peroxiredoxin [Candidatus Sericytochromatia bacterium]|nr:peroxiredoxin [Candidatus Sericytochromatia bacterium]